MDKRRCGLKYKNKKEMRERYQSILLMLVIRKAKMN